MMKYQSITILFVLLFLFRIAQSQCIETGYVKEYNGVEEKTPLPGVELQVVGSPSAVSDEQGRFELHFAVLKPGQAVKYNEIYKPGYILFNKEALEIWRISDNKTPFVVVMCREGEFRALKKKFYGIIEKSYRDDYLRQKKLAETSIANELELTEKLKQLEKSYQEKLSNINTYVEIFARIDRNEMDDKISRALQLVEEGKIDEGIRLYEELELIGQTNEQLNKWNTGERVIQAGQTMKNEAQQDLLLMADKLRQQVGLYEMGGWDYNDQRIETTHKLVEVYRLLNKAFPGEFAPQLGQWLCLEGDNSNDPDTLFAKVTEAARLPSYAGLIMLGNLYEYRSVKEIQYLEKARSCYEQALSLISADDSSRYAEKRLNSFYDFTDSTTGHPIYYKILSAQEKTVAIWPKSIISYNDPEGELVLPEFVKYKGEKYRLVSIGANAFKNNKRLLSVTLPESIIGISENAFHGCFSLESLRVGENVEVIAEGAIPESTLLTLPDNTRKLQGWLYDFIYKRFEFMLQDPTNIELAGHTTYHLIDDLLKDKVTSDDNKAFYWYLKGHILADSVYTECNLTEAIVCFKQALEKGGAAAAYRLGLLYYFAGDYRNAYEFYVRAADAEIPDANNQLAYMYAKGQYVKQDFTKAMVYIDKAIAQDSANPNYIDSKGEIYLMMGQRDKAIESWNKVVKIDPAFDRNQSELYKKLYGIPETKLLDPGKRLNKYVNIVQAMARTEHERFFNACEMPEYEELLAIGIIAVQTMIKNKTPEQLEKYNAFYLASAIQWAIQNELQIRYKWYAQIISHQNLEIKKENKWLNQNQMVLLSMYQNIASLYNHIDWFQESSLQAEIRNAGRILLQAIDSIPVSYRDLARQLIYEQKFVSEIAKEQGRTFEACYKDIIPIVHFLRQSISIVGQKIEYNKNITFDPNVSVTSDMLSSVPPQKYLDIVRIIAQAEQKNLIDRKQNFIDYEELLSVGTIAMQVLTGRKTAEVLEQYSDVYLATAIHWAIQNELNIRYKWYTPVRFGKLMSSENKQDSSISQYTDIVYLQTAGALYNSKDSIDNRSLRAEIEQVGNAILKEINRLPADQRQWMTALFIHQKELEELAQEYGIRGKDCLKSLSPFWKKVREIVKEKH